MSFQFNIEQVQALRRLTSALNLLTDAFDYADEVNLTDKIDISPFKPKVIEDARKVVAEIDALVSHPILTQASDLPIMISEDGHWIPDSLGVNSRLMRNLMARFSGPLDADSGDPRRFGGNLALLSAENQVGILQEVPVDCDCASEHSEHCLSRWNDRIRELQPRFKASTMYVAHGLAGSDGNLVIGAFTPLKGDLESLRFDDPYGDDGQTIEALMTALNDLVMTLRLVTPVDSSTADSSTLDLNW